VCGLYRSERRMFATVLWFHCASRRGSGCPRPRTPSSTRRRSYPRRGPRTIARRRPSPGRGTTSEQPSSLNLKPYGCSCSVSPCPSGPSGRGPASCAP
jgi:hypothetical protein